VGLVSPVLALSSGTTMWYLARGSGVVTLVFLTISVVLGIVTSFRWSSPNWPRFVVEFVHRNVSLLVVVFLGIHVVTVLLDAFAPIRIVDVFVPFISQYRPIWLGLGAVAFDLVVALVVTSLLRHRIGYSGWRIVHWLAYACWPVAVVHGLGTGSDVKSGLVFGVTVACVAAVLLATAARVYVGLAARPAWRGVGLVAVIAAPVVLAGWLANGPLAAGWAHRAGTPSELLVSSSAAAPTSGGTAPGRPTPTPTTVRPAASAIPAAGFTARVTGTVQQSARDARGLATLALVGNLSDGATGVLDVELVGVPSAGGGVSISSGTVTLTGGAGVRWTGPVTQLSGNQVFATVTGPTGARLQLGIQYSQLDQRTGQMAGTVTGAPPTASPRGERDDDR